MKRILLMLAVTLGLLLGGLLPTGTAEARPWGYRGYAYRPAVSVYAGPRYGYRGYYAPYYRPYYRRTIGRMPATTTAIRGMVAAITTMARTSACMCGSGLTRVDEGPMSCRVTLAA